MRTKTESVSEFIRPDIFSAYAEAPAVIQKRVKSQIAPFAVLKYLFFALAVLFLSPLTILLFKAGIFENDDFAFVAIGTLCAVFCLVSILAGIYLSKVKTPYIQEWKDKLGYIE
ncbi:MAG: hypothetical protein IT569_07905 [Leptospiraceae bacterium]|nr:hypothetical protein [Leptospiraceae bacterium]